MSGISNRQRGSATGWVMPVILIVEWSEVAGLNEPLIEAVMVGMDGAHGVAFIGQSREIGPER